MGESLKYNNERWVKFRREENVWVLPNGWVWVWANRRLGILAATHYRLNHYIRKLCHPLYRTVPEHPLPDKEIGENTETLSFFDS